MKENEFLNDRLKARVESQAVAGGKLHQEKGDEQGLPAMELPLRARGRSLDTPRGDGFLELLREDEIL